MKEHLILESFQGSQDGIHSESFVAGTTRMISESLAQALGGERGGFIKEASAAAREIAAAPPELADAVMDAISDASTEESSDEDAESETAADESADGEKSDGDAPENKARKAAPKNKAKK